MMQRACLGRAFAAIAVAIGLSGCSTTSNKPGELPALGAPAAAPSINWQASVGKAVPGFAPAVTREAVYAASSDGAIQRLDPATGRSIWRVDAGAKPSAGPGADDTLVVVATDKGAVLAFDPDGKSLWKARVTSEVFTPPLVAEGIVIVFSGDGIVYALSAADGARKWVFQRVLPPLTVRNYAGGVVYRGGLFIGLAGGRLVALDLATGAVGWDGAVATPRGATELERIADVTSRPLVDDRQACAAAFQGRTACFDVVRGTLNWSREMGSLGGIAGDERNVFVTDDKGAVHALDRATGASLWRQEVLAKRFIGGPQLVGEFVGVVDVEGYLHLLAKTDGAYVGRLATDGSAPTTQPMRRGGSAVWQSTSGTVYSATAR